MNKYFHWFLGGALNLIVIVILIKTAWNGNDKAIVVVVFYYFVLIVANGLIGIVLKFFKNENFVIYGIIILCLVILLAPVLYLASLY